MSQDPFQGYKFKKYTKSIPGREFIIKHLVKREKPATRAELVSELHIIGVEQTEAFRRRLRAMERDGQIVFTRRQRCYALPERLDLVKGTVIGHRDGFGFLRMENSHKDDLYLSSEQMKMCIHGDKVLAQPLGIDRKGRREARVVRILVPKTSQIVGRYFIDAVIGGFVIPDDSRLNFNILIPQKEILSSMIGFVVVVELTQRPTYCTKAIGKIVEILGNNMGTTMAISMALRTHEIPYIWPKAVEDQIKDLREEIPEESKVGRVDLRDLQFITIDGEDACDFDDAIYCKRKRSGGWRLWVAIADVSYYVRVHTPLDNEARCRGTSVYFPLQVIPMLPEVLSNNLCSLNPKVDRLCMICEMTISSKGHLTSYKFYEAVMNSHARLTYTIVWNILQGDQKLRKQYEPLVKHIEELYNLYKILELADKERGGIVFENEEANFIFNSERRIERIEQVQRNDAHKLVEKCMILSNISAAKFVEKTKEPALFRIHDRPTTEAVATLRFVLAELGLELSGGNRPEPHNYAALLESIANRPDAEMLQTMLLRSMKQAIYDPENRGHFGLALSSYTHFTSPIRRYPDLLLHRTIKHLLKQGKTVRGKRSTSTATGGWHYTIEEMLQLGQHCSMTERRADEATREVSDWLKCDFMQNQVGNIFRGVITSVTGFGFFVRLDKLFIDGLVHVSSLDNDYYYFDQAGQRLIGESGGQTYRLGDRVKVKVESVNIDERKIDFSLISSERISSEIHVIEHKKIKHVSGSKIPVDNNTSSLVRKEILHRGQRLLWRKSKASSSKIKKEKNDKSLPKM